MEMLPYAKAVATKYDAELILLHVENDAELAKTGSDQLEDLKVRCVLFDGDPAEAIVEFARSEKIDLIAMPTHGYGGFRRLLIGSVTAKVLHDVSVSGFDRRPHERGACPKPCRVLECPLCDRFGRAEFGRSQMGDLNLRPTSTLNSA